MASTSCRFLLIDQSFRDFAGHHHEYNASVLASARDLGFQCMIATHASFAENALCGAPVVGRFRETWNDAAPGGAILRRFVGILPSAMRHRLISAGARAFGPPNAPVPAPDRQFAYQVRHLIASLDLGAGDHVLIHTLSEPQLLALAELLGGARGALPRLHVVLRYDGSTLATQAFARMAPARDRAIVLWTDTRELAEHYSALGADQIGVLPIPQLILEGFTAATRASGALVLGSLGGARGDKGFHLLPGLARSLADNYLAPRRARFVIQANYAVSREEPLMARCKRELAAMPREWVQLVDHALGQDDFLDLLRSIDILLLPYSEETYRRRSSGLLIQAAIVGIPTIVPANTWLSGEAPSGSAIAFSGAGDLGRAVRTAIERYAHLSHAALQAAAGMRARHNAAQLMQVMTSAA